MRMKRPVVDQQAQALPREIEVVFRHLSRRFSNASKT